MIRTFANRGTENIFNGKNTREARRICDQTEWPIAIRKLTVLNAAQTLDDLRIPYGNRMEALSGDRAGQHSIRINDKYRICFVWTDQGVDAVEIVDYH
jgi:proteic killer suppression protein